MREERGREERRAPYLLGDALEVLEGDLARLVVVKEAEGLENLFPGILCVAQGVRRVRGGRVRGGRGVQRGGRGVQRG